MKKIKINWKAGAALLIACVVSAAPLCAAAANRVISLTAGVFFLLAQDMVELPAGSGKEASVRTAEVSVDLLRLCSESSFDGLFAGDETCLDLLEDAGFTADPAWTEETETESGDQERWEILKEAVLSLAD